MATLQLVTPAFPSKTGKFSVILAFVAFLALETNSRLSMKAKSELLALQAFPGMTPQAFQESQEILPFLGSPGSRLFFAGAGVTVPKESISDHP